MKKLILISLMTIGVTNVAYAGGDILPPVFVEREEVVPVEPIAIPSPVVAPIVKETPKAVPVVEEIDPSGWYVGLGLTAARYDPNCACPIKGQTDDTIGYIGRLGYDFNQYIGVEARALKTKWRSEGGDVEHYGLFVKPMYPVSTDVNVYALAGYGKTETPGITRRKTDAEAFAWGIGLEYDLGSDVPKKGRYDRDFDGYGDQEGGWGLFTDYERLVQKSGSPDLDAISFGVTYDF